MLTNSIEISCKLALLLEEQLREPSPSHCFLSPTYSPSFKKSTLQHSSLPCKLPSLASLYSISHKWTRPFIQPPASKLTTIGWNLSISRYAFASETSGFTISTGDNGRGVWALKVFIRTLIGMNESVLLVAQSGPTLWDPKDYSPPGSSVHGILQARILECVTISFSRRSSQPREWT